MAGALAVAQAVGRLSRVVPVGLRHRAAALVELTKPRIIELLLVTTLPAMFLAEGGIPPPWLMAATLVGGALTAGAANVFNMILDRDIDAVMARTRGRPLPTHRLGQGSALAFGGLLSVLGPLWLVVTVNWLAAAIAAAGMVFYVYVYTLFLKRRTTQNIVIGGAAGAVPALVGWAAVTGSLDVAAWLLFAVVFLWTPPHFWALAVMREEDYAAAGVPMLPVVKGPAAAARSSLRYAIATVVASLALPFVHPRVGWIYLVAASCLGALFVARATRFRKEPNKARARELFVFSIFYLTVLSLALVVDQVTPPGEATGNVPQVSERFEQIEHDH